MKDPFPKIMEGKLCVVFLVYAGMRHIYLLKIY